jgi:hypothetical protein
MKFVLFFIWAGGGVVPLAEYNSPSDCLRAQELLGIAASANSQFRVNRNNYQCAPVPRKYKMDK